MGWDEERTFVTDDRDVEGRGATTLGLSMGGNGDWYLRITGQPEGEETRVQLCVRLAMSRGNSLPGLPRAMANLYRALGNEPPGQRFEDPKYLLHEEIELLVGFAEKAPPGTPCPLNTTDPLLLRLWELTKRRAP